MDGKNPAQALVTRAASSGSLGVCGLRSSLLVSYRTLAVFWYVIGGSLSGTNPNGDLGLKQDSDGLFVIEGGSLALPLRRAKNAFKPFPDDQDLRRRTVYSAAAPRGAPRHCFYLSAAKKDKEQGLLQT